MEHNETTFLIFQVSIPALHISLGTYKKFFDLLEEYCYQLDFMIAGSTSQAGGLERSKIDKLGETWQEITLLRQQIRDLDRTINLVHDAIAQNIAKDPW